TGLTTDRCRVEGSDSCDQFGNISPLPTCNRRRRCLRVVSAGSQQDGYENGEVRRSHEYLQGRVYYEYYPDLGRADGLASLVCDLRRRSRPAIAGYISGDAIPDQHRSRPRSAAQSGAHDEGARAKAAGARAQVALARGGRV